MHGFRPSLLDDDPVVPCTILENSKQQQALLLACNKLLTSLFTILVGAMVCISEECDYYGQPVGRWERGGLLRAEGIMLHLTVVCASILCVALKSLSMPSAHIPHHQGSTFTGPFRYACSAP